MYRYDRKGCETSVRLRIPTIARACAATLIGTFALNAQNFLVNPLTTAGINQTGLHIYNVSVFTGVSTFDNRWIELMRSIDPTSSVARYSTSTGVSTSLGLHLGRGLKSNFSVVYSPSYAYVSYGSGWSSLTQTLALTWNQALTSRWQFSASASAAWGNFDQLLFSPTSAQTIASLPGTFDQFAGTLLNGQSDNQALNAASASSTTLGPLERFYYGNRVFSGSTSVSLTYARSKRLNIAMSASGSRMQHLYDTNAPVGRNAYLIPQSTSGSAAVSMNYSLSPRTSLTAQSSYGRSFSSIDRTQFLSTQLGIGRKLTQHLFASVSGGAGYVIPVGSGNSFEGVQSQLSASVGYRVSRHTFLVSTSRSVSDYYGVGAAATLSSTGAWSWSRRGSNWGLQAGFGQDRLLGQTTFGGDHGWRANAGLHWIPVRGTVMTLQYAYLSLGGAFSELYLQPTRQPLIFHQHAVRLTFGFGAPAGGDARANY